MNDDDNTNLQVTEETMQKFRAAYARGDVNAIDILRNNNVNKNRQEDTPFMGKLSEEQQAKIAAYKASNPELDSEKQSQKQSRGRKLTDL